MRIGLNIEMIYLALVLSMAPAQGGVANNQSTAAVVNRFAQKLGVQDLKISRERKTLAPDWGTPSNPAPMDIVDCRAPNGNKFQVLIVEPETVIRFERVRPPEETSVKTKLILFDLNHPPKEFNPEPLGSWALKEVGAQGPYSYRPLRTFGEGTTSTAIFDKTTAGLRFFNDNPSYSYRVLLNLKTSEIIGVFMPAPLPPVNATMAKIDERKAGRLLRSWGSKHTATDPGAGALVNYPAGKTTFTPELGYYKFPKESNARLVWQGRVTWEGAKSIARVDLRMNILVDATTGELIKPDQELNN